MGFNDLSIILLFFLIGFKIKPIITLVNICVMREATAAPTTPITGIKKQFNIMFASAPERFIIHKYFCLFSASIHIFRIAPRYEKVVYQTTTLSAAIERKNSEPYKI